MNFIEKIKQHWKVILLCFFAVLWMNRCSVACSRESKIENLEDHIEYRDSLLSERDSVINILNNELILKNALLDSEKSHNDNFTSIATDNQAELLKKVYNLTEENRKLNEENKRQKILIKGLTDENIILRSQLDSTIRNK